MNNAQTQIERKSREAIEREIKLAGGQIRGNTVKCPWHDDRHASGSIWQDDDGVQRYKCHVCDAHGDVYDLRARNSGRDVADVLREASGAGKSAQRHARESVFKTVGDLRLAVSRGGQIETEDVYDDPSTGKTDLLVFRLRTANGKAFRQCHPVAGGWVMRAPAKPWPVFNRAGIAKADEVVICEGEKCSDAIIRLGFCATTSPGGAGKAAYADWTPLAGKRRIVLWPDNDEPGLKHMREVVAVLAKLDPRPSVWMIQPTDLDLGPKEDAYDFIEQCRVAGVDAKQAVLSALERAKPTGPLIDYQERLRRIVTGELACLPLPWLELAKLTRLGAPGWLVVIAGRQGAAKTFFALQLLCYWLSLGISASAYWLEGDLSDVLDRTLAQASEIADVTDLDWQKENAAAMRQLTDQYKAELDRIAAAVTVSAGLGLETLEDVASWIEAEANAGRRAIFVDPISAATRKAQPWVSDPAFVRRTKRAARDHECTVILVSHLVKGADEGTPDKVAGSAAYARFSDCVLQLIRHDRKPSLVRTSVGRTEITHNQTLFVEKTRAPGTGLRLAFDLTKGLTFTEHGVILRKG
ncbi:MAG: AAA family ATPase [Planctomycetota bacterium]|jgi:KaiC/GvpD/RAD55 family RecA-like ATPase